MVRAVRLLSSPSFRRGAQTAGDHAQRIVQGSRRRPMGRKARRHRRQRRRCSISVRHQRQRRYRGWFNSARPQHDDTPVLYRAEQLWSGSSQTDRPCHTRSVRAWFRGLFRLPVRRELDEETGQVLNSVRGGCQRKFVGISGDKQRRRVSARARATPRRSHL